MLVNILSFIFFLVIFGGILFNIISIIKHTNIKNTYLVKYKILTLLTDYELARDSLDKYPNIKKLISEEISRISKIKEIDNIKNLKLTIKKINPETEINIDKCKQEIESILNSNEELIINLIKSWANYKKTILKVKKPLLHSILNIRFSLEMFFFSIIKIPIKVLNKALKKIKKGRILLNFEKVSNIFTNDFKYLDGIQQYVLSEYK